MAQLWALLGHVTLCGDWIFIDVQGLVQCALITPPRWSRAL